MKSVGSVEVPQEAFMAMCFPWMMMTNKQVGK